MNRFTQYSITHIFYSACVHPTYKTCNVDAYYLQLQDKQFVCPVPTITGQTKGVYAYIIYEYRTTCTLITCSLLQTVCMCLIIIQTVDSYREVPMRLRNRERKTRTKIGENSLHFKSSPHSQKYDGPGGTHKT